jgi:sterol desaturase/sphingolipid hydroxylase (fatty acid hydroxylase superfamily)
LSSLSPASSLPDLGEPVLRLSLFVAVLLAMGAWEALAPWRETTIGRSRRWPGNLGIMAIDTVVVRVLAPSDAVGVALIAEGRGWGLLQMLAVPALVAIPVAFLILDFAIYAQHVAFHHVPILWRLHRMHHADLELDFTTGVRFHPLEVALSLLIKVMVVVGIGAPAAAVFVFEVALNATSMFNHGNVRVRPSLERLLRGIVVTPDMHRVHHSIVRRETDSNFGFNLPWWDRLFGTYRAKPAAGYEGMTIGIERFRDAKELRLDRMLLQPLRGDEPGPGSSEEARP